MSRVYLRNYEPVFTFGMAMKTKPTKASRNFRLDAGINAELIRRSELLGITQTRLIEDALRLHFSGGMNKLLSDRMATLKGPKAA